MVSNTSGAPTGLYFIGFLLTFDEEINFKTNVGSVLRRGNFFPGPNNYYLLCRFYRGIEEIRIMFLNNPIETGQKHTAVLANVIYYYSKSDNRTSQSC